MTHKRASMAINRLNDTKVYDLVCPLFEIYGYMQQTLQSLPEGDESISALVFVTKRQTEAVCDQVNSIALVYYATHTMTTVLTTAC